MGCREIRVQQMKLTIAICTYRRFPELESCLKNIEKQTLGRDQFKVLVVDNSLQYEKSEEFRDGLELDYEFEYVITRKNGIAFARNVAINCCETDYLSYVDDDVIIPPDWAEILLDTFYRYEGGAGCVSGKIVPKWTSAKPAWLDGPLLWPLAVIDWGDEEKFLPPDEWFVTASIGFDVRLLRQVGGFKEDLGRKGRILLAHEDLQIVTALRRRGVGLVYNPDFTAEHIIPEEKTTEKWFAKDAFWGFVSRAVYVTGKGFDMDSPIFDDLSKSCESVLRRTVAKAKTVADMQRQLAIITKSSSDIMMKYGYDTQNLFPEETTPCVFIVTPTMNSETTIDETIRSVVSQVGDFYIRYHIQDGGSADSTLTCLRNWKEKLDYSPELLIGCKGVHFSYSSAPDDGLYDAINIAFSKLPMHEKSIMGWLNSDDLLMPGAVNLASKILALDEADWVLGHTQIMTKDGILSPCYYVHYPQDAIRFGLCDGVTWKFIQQEGTFWTTKLWNLVGGLSKELKLAGDWDLWRRFARFTEPIHVDAPMGIFRQRDGQLSTNINQYMAEVDRISPEKNRNEGRAVLLEKAENCFVKKYDKDKKAIVREKTDDKRLSAQTWQNFYSFAELVTPPAFKTEATRTDDHPINVATENNNAQEARDSGGPGANNAFRLRRMLDAPWMHWLYKLAPKPVQAACTFVKYKFLQPLLFNAVNYKEINSLKKSGLFWRKWYLEQYPDVRDTGVDPLLHYIMHSLDELRNPNPLFNTAWYVDSYPDVLNFNGSPLFHYIKHGSEEKRDPHPDFSTTYYVNQYSDVEAAGVLPLWHYLRYGILESRHATYDVVDEELEEYQSISDTRGHAIGDNDNINRSKTNYDALSEKWHNDFAISQLAHWRLFKNEGLALRMDSEPETSDLKAYQDLFAAYYIRNHVPTGSKILEVGGGHSRVIQFFQNDYEFWNVDKLEGCGNGPTTDFGVKCVTIRDYMGNFNPDIPNDYFDFVFSISVLEHLPQEDEGLFENVANDLDRVLKKSGQSLHLFDIVSKPHGIWAHPFTFYMLKRLGMPKWDYWKAKIENSSGVYYMTQEAYENGWEQVTGKNYYEFGKPMSFNLLWIKK